jgi:prepilin-type N-terminal cleavage/methylation domain-containing protein
LRADNYMASTRASGFSLLEMICAVSVSLILTAVAVITYEPMVQGQHVTDAYNTTLTTLRRAREAAAADMRIYVVTFGPAVTTGTNPNGGTITVTQTTTTGTQLMSVSLPPDVTFHVESGVPTSPTAAPTTPDGFGSAANAFDFDWGPNGVGGGNTVYFYPDGTAEDANGNVNNGVVYLGRPGSLMTCRAITLWGYTGRLRGWRLYQGSSGWSWSQQ